MPHVMGATEAVHIEWCNIRIVRRESNSWMESWRTIKYHYFGVLCRIIISTLFLLHLGWVYMASSCGPSMAGHGILSGCFWLQVTEFSLGLVSKSARLSVHPVDSTLWTPFPSMLNFKFNLMGLIPFITIRCLLLAVWAFRSSFVARSEGRKEVPTTMENKIFLQSDWANLALGQCPATRPFYIPRPVPRAYMNPDESFEVNCSTHYRIRSLLILISHS